MAFLPAIGSGIAAIFGTTGVAATTAAVAGTAGAIAAGSSLLKGPKIPAMADKPISPSPEKSLIEAEQAVLKKRRETLLTGGLVNPTGPSGAPAAPQNTQRKTLLGQ